MSEQLELPLDSPPHIKIWSVIEGTKEEENPNDPDNPLYFLTVRLTGPMDHEELYDTKLYFAFREDAEETKKKIENNFDGPHIEYLAMDEVE